MNTIHVATVQSNRMIRFGWCVLERQEIVWHLRWTGHFTGTLQAQYQQIQHQAIVLRYKRRKLQTPNDTITVGMIHVFVVNHHVVLGSHVIGNVVINDQTQQTIQQRQIDLFVEFFEFRLQQDIAFPLADIPYVLQVVDT